MHQQWNMSTQDRLSGKHPNDECAKRGDEFNLGKDDLGPFECFLTRCSRFYLKLLSALCNARIVHLDYVERLGDFERGAENRVSWEKGSKATHRRKLGRLLIKRSTLCVYFYTLMRILVLTFFQYKYDFASYRLSKLNGTNSSAEDHKQLGAENEQANRTQLRLDLSRSLNQTDHMLDLIGSPHRQACLFAVIGYDAIVYLTLLTYIIPMLYLAPKIADIFFVGMLLGKRREEAKCDKLVDRELRAVLNSGRNFILANASSCCISQRPLNLPSGARKLGSSDFRLTKMQLYIEEHGMLKEILRKFRTQKRLIPINLTSEWLQRTSKVHATYCSFIIACALVFDYFSYYGIHRWNSGLGLRLGATDIWILADLFGHCMINLAATSFYMSMFNALSTDQIDYSKWLDARLGSQVRQLLECSSLLEPRPNTMGAYQLAPSQRRRGNEILLLALLEFKVYVAQSSPSRPLYRFVSDGLLLCLITISLMVRLHLSYWSLDAMKLGAMLPLITLVFCNTILIPVCRIHHLGARLTKHLWALLAESVRLNGALEGAHLNSAYFEHTIGLYLKLVEDPQRFSNQFVTESLVGKLTYANLLRAEYWFGLLLLSAFVETNRWRELIGPRMNDPFGLLL